MSGENVGLNAYNNPYAMYANYGQQNDDVMANLHFNEIARTGRIPGMTETTGSPAFRGNPETDTFEKSGGIGLAEGAAITAAGAGAGAASGYFLLSNPIKNAEQQILNPAFYKTIDKANLEKAIKSTQEAIKQTKGYNLAQLASVEKFEDLPDEVKTYLKDNGLDKKTPAEAKALLEQAGKKVEDYNLDNIAKQVRENFKGMEYHKGILGKATAAKGLTPLVTDTNDLKAFFLKNKELYGLTGTEEEIAAKVENLIAKGKKKAALAGINTPEELKKFVTENKEFFGIKGTEEEIARKIDNLVAKGKNGVIDEAAEIVAKSQNYVSRKSLDIFSHIDAKGKLAEDAPDTIKKLFKDFKWQQAKKYGKWGAAIAGGIAVLAAMFGGSSKPKETA